MTLFHKLMALRDAGVRVYLVATGAGAGIQNLLWQVPGASAFLVGASFPYEAAQTDEFLGFTPAKYAAPETALDLAMEAYRRAKKGAPERPAAGLALTASVASMREHRGEHRVHVAVVTDDRVLTGDEVLVKGVGAEAREADGATSDRFGVDALLAALGFADSSRFARRDADARARFFRHPAFHSGQRHTAAELLADPEPPLYPGAFDPPHHAHRAIAAKVGGAVFAICAKSPHKEPLALQQMLARAAQFRQDEALLFTEDDPLYLDKARRFPGRTLVLGADALLRMLDPAWGPKIEPMLAEFQQLGTRFLIFGRRLGEEFVSGEEAILRVPAIWRGLFEVLPGRWDISSTDVRHAREAPAEAASA